MEDLLYELTHTKPENQVYTKVLESSCITFIVNLFHDIFESKQFNQDYMEGNKPIWRSIS